MSFDPQFARDTVLPLVQAAYQVFHNPGVDPTLPGGYQKSALLEADPTLLDLIPDLSENARSFVQAVAGVTAVFGGDWCTYSDPQQFFSYRRDGQCGRMAALIWLT